MVRCLGHCTRSMKCRNSMEPCFVNYSNVVAWSPLSSVLSAESHHEISRLVRRHRGSYRPMGERSLDLETLQPCHEAQQFKALRPVKSAEKCVSPCPALLGNRCEDSMWMAYECMKFMACLTFSSATIKDKDSFTPPEQTLLSFSITRQGCRSINPCISATPKLHLVLKLVLWNSLNRTLVNEKLLFHSKETRFTV